MEIKNSTNTNNRTDNDFYIPTKIESRVSELQDKYFEDMQLLQGSIVEKYLWLKGSTKGLEEQRIYELPDCWGYLLNANNYRFSVGELQEGVAGITLTSERTVTISPAYEDNDDILLHEMIHVFEALYDYEGKEDEYKIHSPVYGLIENSIYPFMRDVLFISLYNDVKKKIPELDDLILWHTNIHDGINITEMGGNHDVLFLLKSLDLDLRLGYKLGTICSYGRAEMFA